MLVNGESLRDLFRGFKTTFHGALETGAELEWPRFATFVPSTGSGENYAWLGSIPSLRKWIGPRAVQELGAHNYTIDNEPYELTLGVRIQDIEDDTLTGYNMQAGALGGATRIWPDEVVNEAFEAGDANECYDGQYFFDTDHPVGRDDAATTASNLLDNGSTNAAHPWYLLDTTKIVKPMIWQLRKAPEFTSKQSLDDDNVFFDRQLLFGVDCRGAAGYGLWQVAQRNEGDLTTAKIETGIATMAALKNDENHFLRVRPNILMVPEYHRFTAQRIIERIYNDAAFAPNVLKGLTLVINPYLA